MFYLDLSCKTALLGGLNPPSLEDAGLAAELRSPARLPEDKELPADPLDEMELVRLRGTF